MNKKEFQEIFWTMKKDYDEYRNSIPEIVDYFHISSHSSAAAYDINFKLETEKQCVWFGILNTCMSSSDFIWRFLEKLCADDFKIADLFIDEEGYGPILCAEDVGEGNIRLTISYDCWEEFYFDKELEILITERKATDDWKDHIQFDAILNKRQFIYQMFIELLCIFSKGSYENKLENIMRDATSSYPAIMDSEVIRKYLGFVEATELDMKLIDILGYKHFKDGWQAPTIDEIENLLKQGANPNAIAKLSIGYYEYWTIFDYVAHSYSNTLFFQTLYNDKKYKTLKRYSSKEKFRKELYEKYWEQMQLKQIEIINLLAKYGGISYKFVLSKFPSTTIDFYRMTEVLLKHKGKMITQERNTLLRLNRSIIDLCKKYKISKSY